jgi:bacillithiol biosynthesis cysteine-adding enzyme BshC
MAHSSWLQFNELPPSVGGFSKLYIDYVQDFAKVHQYFEHDFRPMQSALKQIQQMQFPQGNREILIEVLQEQNLGFGASPSSLENIQSLRNSTTFAVVTGQQVGMLGGPLYTFYKTITAIKLAQQLSAAHPEYKFIPVFWLEGEDHDFDEIKGTKILNGDNVPTSIDYLVGGKPLDKNIGAVGEIVLDEYLQTFFDQLQKSLHNSDFKSGLMDMLRNSYITGATMNSAFARFLNAFFLQDGLVFISANDKRLKQILSPVFQKEIQEFPKVSQMIIQKSAELEEKYHAQIKTKALNLFLFHKGGRYFIEPRENDFSLKGTRHYMTKEELLRIATETPELLSPNVALRPICQDTLLPTVAYVGGPSEIAYFAQLKPVYKYFNLTMPVIYPRASATIVEEKIAKVVEKYELEVVEFFGDHQSIKHKVVEMISEVKINDMFGDASKRLSELLQEMKFGLNYIDPTLAGPLDSTRERIESNIQQLKEKVIQAQERKHETALRQLDKAINNLFPNGNYQERELSFIYYINKHGLDFFRMLNAELQIDKFQHQLITPG